MAMFLRRIILTASIGVGLMVLGMLSGVVIDQLRFEHQRQAVLKPYEDALLRRSLQDIDDARETGNPGRAVAAWRGAYAAAVRSGRWDAMTDVGDAALRVGPVPEFRETPRAAARRSYLTALFRARGQRSIDGVLRACQGFALLGDVAVVQQCVRIGQELTAPERFVALDQAMPEPGF